MGSKVWVSLGILLGVLVGQPAGAESLRERLVASEEVSRLAPLDAHHSFLVPAGRMSALYVELVREALALGGTPEVLVSAYDSFTRANATEWVPVSLFLDAAGNYAYHHPVTGQKQPFGYGDFISTAQINAQQEHPPMVRMRGQFSLFKRRQREPIGGQSLMVRGVVGDIVIVHDQPQPFVYKEPTLPPQQNLVAPPPGLRNASNWDFRRPEDDTLSETLQKGLKMIGVSNWEHLPRPYGERDSNFFYLLGYSGLCKNQGGEISYLLRDPDGLLMRPGAGRLYGFFVFEGMTWNTDFFISCSGGQREFAVNMHTYSGGKRDIQFRDGTTADKILATVQPELERVQKKAMYERILEMPLIYGFNVKLPPLAGLTGYGDKPSAPSPPQDPFDEVALKVLSAQGDLTQKGHGGGVYEGYYNGVLGGCDHASVIHKWQDNASVQESAVWNYQYCAGQVRAKKQTRLPGLAGHQGAEETMARVVAQARQTGVAEFDDGAWVFRAVALNDTQTCGVEVRVFEGLELKGRETRHGCSN